MKSPIIMLVGNAGAGKDTVASFLVKNHGAVSIAMADPMKRFVHQIFEFTEHQLWGPSEARNVKDPNFAFGVIWEEILKNIKADGTDFIYHLMPDITDKEAVHAANLLWLWAVNLREEALKDGGLSARKTLQTLGTEWARAFSKDIWIDYAMRLVKDLLSGGCRYDRTQGLIDDEAVIGFDYIIISDGRFRNELVSVLMAGGETWKIETPGEDGGSALSAESAGHRSETEQKGIPLHFFTHIIVNDKSLGLDECEAVVGEVMNNSYQRLPARLSRVQPPEGCRPGTRRETENHRKNGEMAIVS